MSLLELLRLRLSFTTCPAEIERLIERYAAGSDAVPTPDYPPLDW